MQYLTISNEQFFTAYNDYEFCYNYTTDYNGFEYLSWSAAYVLLKRYYPTFNPVLDTNEDNSYVFKVANNLENKEQLQLRISVLESELEVEKDYKKKKKLLTDIEDYKNQLTYDNRGLVLKPHIVDSETGLRTPSIYFPVMSNTMSAVFNSDSRELTDNIQRAFVKVIAVQTGLGLRLYSREQLPKPEGGKPQSLEGSQMVKVIKAIVDFSEQLGKEIDKSIVNFGTNYNTLKQLAIELREEVNKLNK